MELVVVPAYNEEKSIGRVLRGLFEHGLKNVVVVSDGSTDNTDKEAEILGAMVVRHKFNRGQGAALETGNEYARRIGATTVIHFDADDQHDPSDIFAALELMKKNELDAVLGSRFLKKNRLPLFKRFFILPLAKFVNFLFTGVWLTDAHNGFRVLGQRALASIRIAQDGMAHNSEIVAALKKHQLKFEEMPVTIRYHEFGQGIRGGIRVIVDLVKALFV